MNTKNLLYSGILLTLLFLFIIPSGLNAKDYRQKRHEISAGYGVAPLPQWAAFAKTVVTLGILRPENGKYSGAVSASYGYRLSRVVNLGVTYSFSKYAADLYLLHVNTGRENNTYQTVMPMVKISWLNSRVITLYSRAALGITFNHCKTDYTNEEGVQTTTTGNETQVGFQFSPVGIEIGKTVALFAETGLGNMGSIVLGLRLKL